MSLTQLCALFLPLLTLAGAFTDIFSYRIPNVLTFSALPTFLLYTIAAHWSLEAVAMQLLFGLVILVATMGMFFAGLFGGGDAKMLAAVALWLPPSMWLESLLATSIVGLVLACLLALLRTLPLPPRVFLNRYLYGLYAGHNGNTGAMPYGVAIAGGVLLTLTDIARAIA